MITNSFLFLFIFFFLLIDIISILGSRSNNVFTGAADFLVTINDFRSRQVFILLLLFFSGLLLNQRLLLHCIDNKRIGKRHIGYRSRHSRVKARVLHRFERSSSTLNVPYNDFVRCSRYVHLSCISRGSLLI